MLSFVKFITLYYSICILLRQQSLVTHPPIGIHPCGGDRWQQYFHFQYQSQYYCTSTTTLYQNYQYYQYQQYNLCDKGPYHGGVGWGRNTERAYLLAQVHTCITTYNTYLPTYMHVTYMHTYVPTYLHTNRHTYMHACIKMHYSILFVPFLSCVSLQEK